VARSSTANTSVLIGDRLVGLSAKTGYTVNIGGWSSIATIDVADADDGSEVSVLWGEEDGGTAKPAVERHVQARIRATIRMAPLV
jgi:vanillate/3-O-methylgallate O-demethylase